MSKKIIFCQSPADVYYTVALYEQFKNDFEVEIYTLNNVKNFIFLQSLGLKCKLTHIPYPPKDQNKLSQLIFLKWSNSSLYRKHFSETAGADFYFFSLYFDYVLFYFLNKLERKNSGYLMDHYHSKGSHPGKLSLKQRIGKMYYSMIVGKSVEYENLNSRSVIYYGKNLNYAQPVINYDLSSFKQHIVPKGERSILIFEGDDGNHFFSQSKKEYQHLITQLIDSALEQEFHVYIKPHPRLGYSDFLKQLRVKIIDEKIPGEFIEYGDFSYIFGNVTKVLASLALQNDGRIFSLIDLLPFDTENSREYYRSYLLRSSNQKLRSLRSFEDLIHLLSKQ